MRVTNNFEKIHEIKEFARRNMFGFRSEEDLDYIEEHLEEILHTVYFVFDEWERMKKPLLDLKNTIEEMVGNTE